MQILQPYLSLCSSCSRALHDLQRCVRLDLHNHGHRLTTWNQLFLAPAWLEQYARAIHEMRCPLANCLGFIDGTIRPISRPREHQRLVYNGHKQVRSLKFQSLVIPNGLIANLFGPVEGR